MKNPTTAVWIGIILLIASWLYPPWLAIRSPYAYHRYHHDGFYFLFDPWNENMRIDWMRLVFIDLVIVAIIAGWLFTLRQRKSQN